MVMNVYSDLSLRGNLQFGKELTDFPLDPTPGQLELIDGVLWLYTTVQGVSTWYPLNNKKNSYVHTQGVAAAEWTINHGLGTSDVLYMAYGPTGSLVIANRQVVDENTIKLLFTEAVTGRAVIFAEAEAFVPAIQAKALTAQTAVIGGTVVASINGLTINGFDVAVKDSLSRVNADLLGGVPAADFMTADQTNAAIQAVVGAAPSSLDTLAEIGAQLAEDESATAAIVLSLSTKAESDLSNVSSASLQTALGYVPADAAQLGVPGGIATLDVNGQVELAQLPTALLTAASSFELLNGAAGVASEPGTVVVLDETGHIPAEQVAGFVPEMRIPTHSGHLFRFDSGH